MQFGIFFAFSPKMLRAVGWPVVASLGSLHRWVGLVRFQQAPLAFLVVRPVLLPSRRLCLAAVRFTHGVRMLPAGAVGLAAEHLTPMCAPSDCTAHYPEKWSRPDPTGYGRATGLCGLA